MDTNWKYGDFRKGKVSEVEITPIVRYGKAKAGKSIFYISMTLIKRIIFNIEKDFLNINKTIQSWTLGKKVETSLMNSNAKDFSIQLDLGGDLGSSRPGFYGWYTNERCEDKKISFNLRNK